MIHPRAIAVAGLLGAILVATFGAAGLAVAHGGDEDQVHACINDRSGLVRIVGASEACRSGETARHWPAEIPADPGVTGLGVYSGRSDEDSENSKEAFVQCPTGQRAVGGGGQVNAGVGDADNVLALHGTRPDGITIIGPGVFGPPRGWAAFAGEVTPFAGNWTVSVYAVCADAP